MLRPHDGRSRDGADIDMQIADTTLKQRQEWAQPALVAVSAAIAYLVPFEGLLFSYALLGPAHYLTQLNWLHDRDYFIADRGSRLLFIAVGIGGLLYALYLSRESGLHGTLYMIVMVGMAVILLGRFSFAVFAALTLAVAGAGWWLKDLPAAYVILALLLPTIIHVALFTLLFLLVGAQKRGDVAGKATALCWIGAAGLVLVFPPDIRLLWPDWFTGQRRYFDAVARNLGAGPDLPLDRTWAAAYGLLTFAYTYHYINWFSKTELLRWHRIAPARLYPIVAIYIVSIGLYIYDYALGFAILLLLSFIHVIAELPLDAQVARTLVRGMLPGPARAPRPG